MIPAKRIPPAKRASLSLTRPEPPDRAGETSATAAVWSDTSGGMQQTGRSKRFEYPRCYKPSRRARMRWRDYYVEQGARRGKPHGCAIRRRAADAARVPDSRLMYGTGNMGLNRAGSFRNDVHHRVFWLHRRDTMRLYLPMRLGTAHQQGVPEQIPIRRRKHCGESKDLLLFFGATNEAGAHDKAGPEQNSLPYRLENEQPQHHGMLARSTKRWSLQVLRIETLLAPLTIAVTAIQRNRRRCGAN